MESHFDSVIKTVTALSEKYYYAGQLEGALNIMAHGVAICDRAEIAPNQLAEMLLTYTRLQAVAIFMTNSRSDAALKTVERVQSLPVNSPLKARADDLTGLIHYYAQLGRENPDFTLAQHALDQVTSYEVVLPPDWHCEWLFHRGLVYQNTERIEAARECFQECYDSACAAGLKEIQSFAVRHLGFIQQHTDQNLSAARASFEESLQLREAISLKIYLPFSYQTLGTVCMAQGDIAAAEIYLDHARRSASELGNQRALVLSLMALGDLERSRGKLSH
jgi:tetratricopeptide (TPR) repeat protein